MMIVIYNISLPAHAGHRFRFIFFNQTMTFLITCGGLCGTFFGFHLKDDLTVNFSKSSVPLRKIIVTSEVQSS